MLLSPCRTGVRKGRRFAITQFQNVFFITGMSDRSWLDQTRERVLPCWRKNVYHRNTLHKMSAKIKSLEKRKDILIILDECHLANKKQFILRKTCGILRKILARTLKRLFCIKFLSRTFKSTLIYSFKKALKSPIVPYMFL